MFSWRMILSALVLVLSGCAGPQYWHEPPQPAADAGLQGQWQGLMRSSSVQHYTGVGLTPRVRVRCPQYRDLIRFEVSGQRLDGGLGREPVVRFSTTLDAEGRFSVALPVQGDTWIWGGVLLPGIEDRSPLLVLQGQLDGSRGTGRGWLSVSPNEPRLGCSGHFEVSRNGGAPPDDAYGRPFEIRYWIDEVRTDRRMLWPHWPRF
jgi:hypothetical protein